MFEEYLCTYHADELLDILKYPDKNQHYSLTIKYLNLKIFKLNALLLYIVFLFSFLTLFEKNAKLGEEILVNSINLLEQCDQDMIAAQKVLKNNFIDKTAKLCVKKKVHTRITG